MLGSIAALIVVGAIGSRAARLAAFRDMNILAAEAPDRVEVRPGETATGVVRRLVGDGVMIDDPSLWLWLRWARPGGCLQAGVHALPPRATARELFAVLCETTYRPSVRLTVPEGTNLFQLETLAAAAGLSSATSIVSTAGDEDLIEALGLEAPTLEGYLLPETYDFDADVTARALLERLAVAGEEARRVLFAARDPISDELSVHEVLTIASIVEEEARIPEERPRIARVLYNRIARGMKLQCDATCVYGPDLYGQTPTRALCRDPRNRWSTYVVDGLPPTPISNPGRDAIRAALNPSDEPDLLFFVSMNDGSGRHAFADDLASHERNVDRYIRGRR